mmetsp:Transcript_13955/g.31780  ORF Transcript_13955/g.31780 Transcript_13955/m.31780 type:complete len:119 (+) Transcript_13955:3-359(+)
MLQAALLAALALAALLLVVYGRRAWRSFARWRSKRRRLDEINSTYEALRSLRQDAVYHHGWAKSRGEPKEAIAHAEHVEEIDRKLEVLRQRYEAVEAGGIEEDDVARAVVVEERCKDK